MTLGRDGGVSSGATPKPAQTSLHAFNLACLLITCRQALLKSAVVLAVCSVLMLAHAKLVAEALGMCSHLRATPSRGTLDSAVRSPARARLLGRVHLAGPPKPGAGTPGQTAASNEAKSGAATPGQTTAAGQAGKNGAATPGQTTAPGQAGKNGAATPGQTTASGQPNSNREATPGQSTTPGQPGKNGAATPGQNAANGQPGKNGANTPALTNPPRQASDRNPNLVRILRLALA